MGTLRSLKAPQAYPLALILRVVVYAMLACTAGITVVFGEALWTAFRDGLLPRWAPLIAPAAFTAFTVVYTLDRWFLVRHRGYSQSRALMQVAFALIFLTLLLQPQAQEMRLPRPAARQDAAAMLLCEHPDASVRAAACETFSGQVSVAVFDRVVGLSQHDVDEAVRQACILALERLHTATAEGRVGPAAEGRR